MAEGQLCVEVALAIPERQIVASLRLPVGATVAAALARAADEPCFAGLAIASHPAAMIAVYGRLAPPDQRLHDGDRIELLRPLSADPKDQRRERVRAARRQQRRQ